MSHKVYVDDDDDIMLYVYVDNYEVYGCNLKHVTEDKREWFANHIDQAFQRHAQNVRESAIREHNARLRNLLGIV